MFQACEQPCTHRDALFAARYFHLLQGYPDRVGLATIAQSVNVLHTLLRTSGPRSYRTPTFHVFEMFKNHQGADALDLIYTSPQFEFEQKNPAWSGKIDKVTASASIDNTKEILLTMTNADLEKSYDYEIDLVGSGFPATINARVLTADPRAGNTYEAPDAITPKTLKASLKDNKLTLTLPACSVVALSLK